MLQRLTHLNASLRPGCNPPQGQEGVDVGFKHREAAARREVPEAHHAQGASLRGSQQGAVPIEGQRRHLREATRLEASWDRGYIWGTSTALP